MSFVTIELVDEHGSVRAGVNFQDGFNRYSAAHQTANMILRHLDEIMQRKEDITDVADKLGVALS